MGNAWLAHHGVQGMKWGVRRFQNYDGSYTKKGLDHYRKAEKRYDEADAAYKSTKLAKKQGQATSEDVKRAKMARKSAKADMEFNYKQLKKDYLADQGKEMYKNGRRITIRARQQAAMAMLIEGGTIAVTHILKEKGRTSQANLAWSIGQGMAVGNALMGLNFKIADNKMREYYDHKGVYK